MITEFLGVLAETLSEDPLASRLFFASLELGVLAVIVVLLSWSRLLRSSRVAAFLWVIVLAKPLATLVWGSPIGLPVLSAPTSEVIAAPKDAMHSVEPTVVLLPSSEAAQLTTHVAPSQETAALSDTSTRTEILARPVVSTSTSISWIFVAKVGWLGGCLLFFVWHVVQRIRLFRLRSRAASAGGAVLARYAAIASELEIGSAPCLKVTDELDSPAIAGVFSPVVFVPSWLLGREHEKEFGWAMRHELTHWKWRDPYCVLLRDIVLALFFFHPGAWLAGRRLVEMLERACDRSMLRRESDAEAYAEGLYSLLKKMGKRRRFGVAGGLFASRTQVGARVQALLKAANGLSPQLTWMSGVALAVVAVIVFSLGAALGQGKKVGYEDAPPASADHRYRVGEQVIAIEEAAIESDAVIVKMSPGSELFDILELRVFESATQDLVASIGEDSRLQTKRRVAAEILNDAIRLEPMGDALPEHVDLWLRVRAYPSEKVETMPSSTGFAVKFGDSRVMVSQMSVGVKPFEIRNGKVEWGPDERRENEGSAVTVVFRNVDEPLAGDFQVCARDKMGKKHWGSVDRIRFEVNDGLAVVTFPLSGPELSDFEWRPLGAEKEFYFKAVALPNAGEGDPNPAHRLAGDWRNEGYSPRHWYRFTKDGKRTFLTEASLQKVTSDDVSFATDAEAAGPTISFGDRNYQIGWKGANSVQFRRLDREDGNITLYRSDPPRLLASALSENLSDDDLEALRFVGSWSRGGNEWFRFRVDGTVSAVQERETEVYTRTMGTWSYRDGGLILDSDDPVKVTWSGEDSFVADDGTPFQRVGRGLAQKIHRALRKLSAGRETNGLRVSLGEPKEGFLRRIFGKEPSTEKTEPEFEDDLMEYANIIFEKEFYDLAVEKYQKYVSTYPKGKHFEEARFRLAESYLGLGMRELATAEFKKTVAAFPDGEFGFSAAYRLGSMAYQAEEFADAAASFELAAKAAKDDKLKASSLYYQAESLTKLKKPDAAQDVYSRLLDSVSASQFHHKAGLFLGERAMQRKEYGEAIKFFSMAEGQVEAMLVDADEGQRKELKAVRAQAMGQRARCLASLGREDEAKALGKLIDKGNLEKPR